MRSVAVVLVLVACLASLSSAAEVRMRYAKSSYNNATLFSSSWHPGTAFKPTSSQYPVFLKTAHFGFWTANWDVQVKVWSATGGTPGSLLATFPATTVRWPFWTEVDLSAASIVITANNFFLSTNNPKMGPLGSAFLGVDPQAYPGYHYCSSDDEHWMAWTQTDWAIECTVETNYTGIAPASIGRVKALYK